MTHFFIYSGEDQSATGQKNSKEKEVLLISSCSFQVRGTVWPNKKPLYGTIQGGDYWAEERDEFMVKQLGWTKLESDSSTYRKTWPNGDSAVVAFWVDDATAVGSERRLLELERQFEKRYGISGQGELTWTLGIGFRRNRGEKTITLSQEHQEL